MNKKYLIIIEENGVQRNYPLKQWIRENPQLGQTPDRTTHQLRNELKKDGWIVREFKDQVQIINPNCKGVTTKTKAIPPAKVEFPPELAITLRLKEALKQRFGPKWTVTIDGKLSYFLSEGNQASHKNDILLSAGDKHVAIEVKFKSNVNDQFKARAFDAYHLRQEYDDKILVLMIYVRAERGLSIHKAQSLCYWFNGFFPYRFSEIESDWRLDDLIAAIKEFEEKR